MSPKRIAFIEPLAGGHHGSYLAWLIGAAMARNYEVEIITAPEALQSDDFLENLPPAIERKQCGPFLSRRNATITYVEKFLFRRHAKQWLRGALNVVSPGAEIFFPYLDLFNYQIAHDKNLLAGKRWSGILMATKFHHSECLGNVSASVKDRIERYLFMRLIAQPSLQRLFCLDPLLVDYLSLRRLDCPEKLLYLPDPAHAPKKIDKLAARQELRIGSDKFVVLCYGSMDSRKGFHELVASIQCPQFPNNALIILAGKFPCAETRFVTSEAFLRAKLTGHVVAEDRFMSAHDEALYFSAADLIWLGYKNFQQMSGVFTRAVAFDRPVVGTEKGLIGWHIARTGAGVSMQFGSPTQIACTLGRIANDTGLQARVKKAAIAAQDAFSIERAATIVFGKA